MIWGTGVENRQGPALIMRSFFVFVFAFWVFFEMDNNKWARLSTPHHRGAICTDGRASTVVSGLYWIVLSSTRVRRVREQEAIIRRMLEGCFMYGFVCPRRSQRSTSRDFGDFHFRFFSSTPTG